MVVLSLGADMRRREVLGLLSGAAKGWPFANTLAQQQAKLPAVAFLGTGTLTSQGQWAAAFVQRLRELGWTDGRTVKIDIRWAEGWSDRAAELAAEFVRSNVDVIVTSGTAVAVLKKATSTIPIVF